MEVFRARDWQGFPGHHWCRGFSQIKLGCLAAQQSVWISAGAESMLGRIESDHPEVGRYHNNTPHTSHLTVSHPPHTY